MLARLHLQQSESVVQEACAEFDVACSEVNLQQQLEDLEALVLQRGLLGDANRSVLWPPYSALQCISAVGRPSHHVILWNDNGWGQQLFRGHGSTALVHPCISSLLQALCTKGRASASAAPLQASLTTSPATVVPCLAALMCQQQLSLQLLRQQRAWQPSVQRSSS